MKINTSGLDLDEINEFFANYKEKPMPKSILELVVYEGIKIKNATLETYSLEFRNLKELFFPEITETFPKSPGTDMPLLRISKTANYFVYHPLTGEYLGEFDIELREKEYKKSHFNIDT